MTDIKQNPYTGHENWMNASDSLDETLNLNYLQHYWVLCSNIIKYRYKNMYSTYVKYI